MKLLRPDDPSVLQSPTYSPSTTPHSANFSPSSLSFSPPPPNSNLTFFLFEDPLSSSASESLPPVSPLPESPSPFALPSPSFPDSQSGGHSSFVSRQLRYPLGEHADSAIVENYDHRQHQIADLPVNLVLYDDLMRDSNSFESTRIDSRSSFASLASTTPPLAGNDFLQLPIPKKRDALANRVCALRRRR